MADPIDSLGSAVERQPSTSRLCTFDGLRSACPELHNVFAQLERLALSDAPLLIQGESGTGKHRFAQALHRASARRARPLLTLVCTARSAAQLDTLLGDLTPARRGEAAGLLHRARGGTLVLRDLAALDLHAQGVLLRALQDAPSLDLRPRRRSQHVRLVSTAGPDLLKLVQQGRFRADLYHRLVAARLHLPPLRERQADLPLLAEEALQQAARALGREPPRLDSQTVEVLRGYGWPGNFRELFNVLEQALLRQRDRAELRPVDLSGLLYPVAAPAPVEIPIGTPLAVAERQLILQTLAAHRGQRQATADTLQISRRTLYAKLAFYRKQGVGPREPGGPMQTGARRARAQPPRTERAPGRDPPVPQMQTEAAVCSGAEP